MHLQNNGAQINDKTKLKTKKSNNRESKKKLLAFVFRV